MLHAVYRSTGTENAKGRPAGYSKLRCLRSFLRAWDACGSAGELVFVNSGPIPPERHQAMARAGRLVGDRRLALHESYWAAIDLAAGAGWPDRDLVYFGEDDYLFRPDALTAIAEAAGALPSAAYLAPYATVGAHQANGAPLPRGLRRPRIPARPLHAAHGVTWAPAVSHTSSFAVRLGVLRADRRLHRLAPRTAGAWDHALSLAYQGRAPYRPGELLWPVLARGQPVSRRAKCVAWRLALTGAAAAQRPRRLLVAPRPALATHMEAGMMAEGTNWEEV